MVSCRKWIAAAGLIVLLNSCIEKSQDGKPKPAKTDSIDLITTGTKLVPAFAQMDSIAILFYKDPFGADEERYTRYYTLFTSHTDSVIGRVQQNMDLPFTEDSLRNCRSEGKMYCFSKGKVVQTVYFNTLQQNCTQLYFIHEGRYYYFKPLQSLILQLASLKKQARE
ncbi:MAG TPA: hypothetical protein VLC98_14565 [Phnomibacter sp.]|nr:hypothetical protein [Phnomibacter sp.]